MNKKINMEQNKLTYTDTSGSVKHLSLFLAALVFYQSALAGYSGKVIKDNEAQAYIYYTADTEMEPNEEIRELKEEIQRISAIPGGPDQPEVQSFTPIGASDMVNPFTGDFSYNIPLMDIDGYPINLAYSAGVSMDQEATWVGLGWSLNPGVINRAMRGIPDDFNGDDEVKREFNMKPNWTVGGSFGLQTEFTGFPIKKPGGGSTKLEGKFSVGLNLGINFNSYNGYGAEFGIKPAFKIAKNSITEFDGVENALNFSLGINGSSTGGGTLSPDANFTRTAYDICGDNAHVTGKSSLGIGTSINSRSGMTELNISGTKQKQWYKGAAEGIKGPTASGSFNFGISTYTPAISMPMNTFGVTIATKLGPDVFLMDPTLSVSGYYSKTSLNSTSKIVKAYGYRHLADGQQNEEGMLDFNRENDGGFSLSTQVLPIPILTYDLYNISGQGVSGSYRMQRTDLGYVFDAKQKTNDVSGSAGFEFGMGSTSKSGVDISLTYVNSNSGVWDAGNRAIENLKFNQDDKVYFREANEMSIAPDISHYNRLGGSAPVRFNSHSINNLQNTLEFDDGSHLETQKDYTRTDKIRQNQLVYSLSRGEIDKQYGLEDYSTKGLYAPGPGSNIYISHHIAEMTTLDQEGKRYVYGIAAYNLKQREVGFATDEKAGPGDMNLISYAGDDATVNNIRGTDNYFNATETGPYAHSYLLTAVLGADYIDSDGTKGPSINDKGYYVKLDYQKAASGFGWRNPQVEGKAFYDEGLNTDPSDDKGNYTFGRKELWYLNTIKTKNFVAVFTVSDREDATSLAETGAQEPDLGKMQKLDQIDLYALADFEKNGTAAVPIKTVHFVYEYSLCKNYPMNTAVSPYGKLTLKEVYFTYQNSKRGSHSPYVFKYHGEDGSYAYDPTKVDRWGNYSNGSGNDMKASDFPYVGFDKAQRDADAKAWNLYEIKLPSGGKIQVEYESDDYGYVQHKPAQQMYRIMGIDDVDDANTAAAFTGVKKVSSHSKRIPSVYIELNPRDQDLLKPLADINKDDYLAGIDKLYFRASIKYGNNKFDFVPGWADIDREHTETEIVEINATRYLRLKLIGVTLQDSDNDLYSPIALAGIQYGRLHLSRFLAPSNQAGIDDGADFADMMNALKGAFQSYGEFFKGANKFMYDQLNGVEMELGKSYVRLNSQNGTKLGGGHRVKTIKILDSWDVMTGQEQSTYGQEYSYVLDEESKQSSGVASYEPQLGSDENVWKKPVITDTKILCAPDTRNYQLEPFGESYFPSASVGYSKVTVKDILPANVVRHGTGKVVHEFYTARDFPTIVRRTGVDPKPFRLPSLGYFLTVSINEISATQGFSIENNDMHGKPKSQKVYAEKQQKDPNDPDYLKHTSQNEPISKVEYTYQSEQIVLDGISALHLTNEVPVIHPDGTLGSSTIGLVYEGVGDFRKSTVTTISGTIEGNVNFSVPAILVPSILGSGVFGRTAFRSATFTKSIQRFGILKNTKATDLGSEVETNTLAYDSETGSPLLSQTTTDFNDKVYSFTYPAHWYYEGMGQAYKNISKDFIGSYTFQNTGPDIGKSFDLTSANGFFEGDEVIFDYLGTAYLAWVLEATPNYITLINAKGNYIVGTIKDLKIIRSGRRNMQGTPIGSLTLKSNPLSGLSGNIFENVLDAASVEFKDQWRTDCNCDGTDPATQSTNPYVLGIKGSWRPATNYTHLTDRTQSFKQENSNIRQDGVFKSYNPFYRLTGGKWSIDKRNWTYISSVVDFSPNGMPLETVDALNRYSATRYGFNTTLQTAVAANTRYQELAFNSYEDNSVDGCDGAFASGEPDEIAPVGHTGKNSLIVTGTKVITPDEFACDPPSCDLQFEINLTMANPLLVPSDGEKPYQFEYEIINGEPNIKLTNNGERLSFTGTGWTVRVTVTDAKGCSKTEEYTK